MPRRLIVETAPAATFPHLRRLARALAAHLGWIAIASGQPSSASPGGVLALPPAESRRAWSALLARARWLDGGTRPDWLEALRPAPGISASRPDAEGQDPQGQPGPPVVVITPAGSAELRRTPQRALASLAAYARRHPGAEAVTALDADHLPAPTPLNSVIAAVERLAAAEAAARKGPTLTGERVSDSERGDIGEVSGLTLAASTGRATGGTEEPDAAVDAPFAEPDPASKMTGNARDEKTPKALSAESIPTTNGQDGPDTDRHASEHAHPVQTEAPAGHPPDEDIPDYPGDEPSPS